MLISRTIVTLIVVGACISPALAQEEVPLFDGQGDATAYIAVDDDSTIYLWSGKPVAYLEDDGNGGFHVYGFNGIHLGWLTGGVIRDHLGRVACAMKQRMRSTNFEPFKAFKAFKPFKAFKEYAPFRPFLVDSWSEMPCSLLLGRGGA